MTVPLRNILSALLVCLLTAAALAYAADVRVADLPGNGFVPDALVDGEGVVHTAYVDSTDLFYATSADGGRTWSEPLQVNSEPGTVMGGRYRGPDIAAGADGLLQVIWYNRGYQLDLPKDRWGVEYARIDPSTGEVSGRRNLNRRPSDNYSIDATSSGNVAVIWTAGGMFLQHSTDNGGTFSDPVQVMPGTVDPCECCATRTIFTADGGLLVIYRDKAENIRDMHLLSRPPGGGPDDFRRRLLSAEQWKIDLCPMTGTSLGTDADGNLLAAWETRSNVKFAALAAGGNEITAGAHLVADKGNYPVVLSNDAGEILVAWKWGRTLHWNVYESLSDDSPGTGSSPAPTDDRPAGVVLGDGTFLLIP